MSLSVEQINSLLQSGMQAHQVNQLAQAEQAYKQVLDAHPDHGQASYLLGFLRNQQQRYAEAEALVRTAQQQMPDNGEVMALLAETLRRQDKLTEADNCFDQALALMPDHLPSLTSHANVLGRLEKYDQAHARLDHALQLSPDFLAALNARADLYRLQRNLTAAMEVLDRIVTLNPGDRANLTLLAGMARNLERFDQALDYARRARDLAPDDPALVVDVAAAHLGLGNHERAHELFMQVYALRYGNNDWTREGFQPGALQTTELPESVSGFYLHNAADQLDYLVAHDKLDSSFGQLAERFREVAAAGAEREQHFGWFRLTTEEQRSLGPWLQKVFYHQPATRIAGSCINPDLDTDAIQKQYLGSATAAISLDNFLTPDALKALTDFALESTIFFPRQQSDFLASYLEHGFSCPLMYQIGEELKQVFPEVLGDKPMRGAWIYRHPAEGTGVQEHTDEASVTFNFWISPDEANLDPDSGGLVVFVKEQPADQDWYQLNAYKDNPEVLQRIQDFLADAETLTVPFRCNRAVMFHSNLFHRSDDFRFRDDYQGRRMNITLLFGNREESGQQGE